VLERFGGENKENWGSEEVENVEEVRELRLYKGVGVTGCVIR